MTDPDLWETQYIAAGGLDVVILNANEVLVQFGTRSLPAELFRDPTRRGLLGPMMSAFVAGPADLSTILAGADETGRRELEQIFRELVEKGILARVSSSPIDQYLAYTFTGESSLKSAAVNVIGAGPLGARIARSLVQHGVGKITLMDDRIMDHLPQPPPAGSAATASAAGQRAGDHLFDLLGGAADGVEVISSPKLSVAQLTASIDAHQLTIVAFEQRSLTMAHLVNRICLKANKPWIVASVDGNFGLAGPLFNGRDAACYNCYEALSDSTIASRHMARHYRRHVLQRGTGSFVSGLPVFADIVAGYVSLAALHFLLGKACFLEGRILNVNFDRMILNTEDILKLPRCPVCADLNPVRAPAFDPDVLIRQPSTT
jgi:thiazole/oxazole-forming peptide maturase SagC family component